MSLELNSELIQISKPLKIAKVKSIIDTDIIVPDSKPDVLNVLQVNATASVMEKYLQKDVISVSGNIDYTVLYSSDTDETLLKNIRFKTPFTQQIEINGVSDDSCNYVMCDVSHIEYQIQNSRKINIKSVLSFDTGIIGNYSLSAVSSISSTANVSSKSENIKIFNLSVCHEGSAEISDKVKISLSPDEEIEILKVDCKVVGRELKSMNNKAVAKGALISDILYLRDNDVCHTECEIPFTEVIDAEGLQPHMHTEIKYNVTSAEFEAETAEGECVAVLNAEIGYLIKGFDESLYEIIADAYSPDYELSIDKKQISFLTLKDIVTKSYNVSDTITLPENAPSVVKVYNLIAKPVFESSTVQNGFVINDGYIDVKLLYLSDRADSPVYSANQKIPFSLKTESEHAYPDSVCDTDISLEHVGYILNSDREIEIRTALNLKSKILDDKNRTVISSIEMDEEKPINKDNQSGITIYFTDKNESLWNIAKKYHTTEEDIAEINGINPNEPLKDRQQLMIPKRINL